MPLIHILLCQNATQTPYAFDNNKHLCEFVVELAADTLKKITTIQTSPLFTEKNIKDDIADLKAYIEEPLFREIRTILKIISSHADHNNDKFHLHTVDINSTEN